MFHLAVVINYEKRARSAGHQQLLDGASARDDVGDVLVWIGTRLRFAEAEAGGVCFSVPFRPVLIGAKSLLE